MWVKVKGHMGLVQSKDRDISRWIHINIKFLRFFLPASNKGSGCDIFANVPSDDENDADIPDCDVMFEFSDIPLLPVYSMSLHDKLGLVYFSYM